MRILALYLVFTAQFNTKCEVYKAFVRQNSRKTPQTALIAGKMKITLIFWFLQTADTVESFYSELGSCTVDLVIQMFVMTTDFIEK